MKRRSGRTTRLLQAANAAAMENGRAFVVMANHRQIDYAKRLVPPAKGVSYMTPSFCFGGLDGEIFVDHFVYECLNIPERDMESLYRALAWQKQRRECAAPSA